MARKRLVLFFLLIVAVEFMLLSSTDAWRRRRRRRRRAVSPRPPPCDASIPYPSIKWHNKWHQSFYAYCPNGEAVESITRSDGRERISTGLEETPALQVKFAISPTLHCRFGLS